ncbi:hypothetical protein DWG18_02050 [Lysobacter sp. TY2-98]|uniref:methyltransferase family protein n=1 Tax=Lysobacter sp. TY2-98 TaxID=2290922 RepID=UPI000E20C47F|nr:isoprenylcysteine carboxylmethyltransferase family protein [Lysobacter sp. TY2-98]AXK71186.1 hypothetical protein DWG18_02050 [Lysobacter sp. TY2-98]
MMLRAAMERQGAWLFRWRSYPPVAALALLLLRVGHYHYLGGSKFDDDVWQFCCALLAALGLLVRALVVGHVPKDTSGRNAREQRAEALNTTGLYSLVRHPLYIGNFLIFVGTVAFLHDPWPSAVCILGFWLYHERIMLAEEAFLAERFGSAYEIWAARTPALIPTLRHWSKPSLPFSIRNVLRREYNNVFSVALAMFVLDVASESTVQGRLSVGPIWTIAVLVGLAAWLILRTLKRRTSILRVQGR